MATSAAGYAFENTANRFKVHFAEPGQPNLVRFARDDHWVTLTPTGPLSASVPTVNDNRITYAGLLDGIDLEYQVVADGVKENILLAAPPARHTYTFQMRHSDGVRLAQQPDGSIDFYDIASGDSLWSLAAPYMFDSSSTDSGQPIETPKGYAPVQMELTERGQAGVYQITLTADPAWLVDPARVYPVTIDPSVIIRPSAADTTLFSDAYADNNYGTSTQLAVGYNASGPWKARTLLQFDLSAVPPRSTILDATLGLIVLTQVNPTTHDETLHQVTQSWTETGATWNTYDGTNPWATPGGDYNATPEWTTTVGTVSGGEAVYWHPTALVRKWYTGQAPNYGFLIKSQDETIDTVTYYHSRDASDQSDWPILEVIYTPWLGVQDFWTYETMDLGGGPYASS